MKSVILEPRKAQAGVVYLLKGDGGFYKIGRSAKPHVRTKSFATLPYNVGLAHQIQTDDPAWLEAMLHNRFHEQHVIGEWFTLSDENLAGLLSMQSWNRPLSLRIIQPPIIRPRPTRPVVMFRAPSPEWLQVVARAAKAVGNDVSNFIRAAIVDKVTAGGFGVELTAATPLDPPPQPKRPRGRPRKRKD